MTKVGVHEAKTHFSQLLRRVAAGEEVLILRGGRPAARLVPVEAAGQRRMGTDPDLQVADDFDQPLPAELLDAFQR